MSAGETKPNTEPSLADYGYIAYLFERLFLGLEYAAVLQRFFGLKPRRQHHQDLVSAGPEGPRKALVRRNARRADSYVLTFVGLEGLLLIWAGVSPQSFHSEFFRSVVVAISWYRILDILQNIVNRLIFAPLRGLGQSRMASSVRTLILTIMAYFEVIGCFALLYFVWRSDLISAGPGVGDCIYFSAITQLTIGYGDIVPTRGLRAVSVVQGVLGFFFAAIIVARLISGLPKISGDLERRV